MQLKFTQKHIPLLIWGVGIFCLSLSQTAYSQWFVDVEASVYKPDHNKIQVPKDNDGDRFDTKDLDDDSIVTPRLTLGWIALEKHEFQLVLAPFSYSVRGSFDNEVRFDGETFASQQSVKVRYQFNSYRLRYLFHLVDSERWQTDIGATLFIRDASIKLSQNGKSQEDDNLGAVPLLAFRTAYSLTSEWSMLLDVDVAGASQGRAIDLALLAQYHLDDRWKISAGYRTIEGGVDNDDVYNFAWFNGATIKASYSW